MNKNILKSVKIPFDRDKKNVELVKQGQNLIKNIY